jgi:hypothetical protein
MKFYIENKPSRRYMKKIEKKCLTAIYFDLYVVFFENGKRHNTKNASYIKYNGYKQFWLNGEKYGSNYDQDQDYFTKESWRRFCKLQIFL